MLTASAAKVIVGVGTFMGADMVPMNDPSNPGNHAAVSDSAGPGGAVVLPPNVPVDIRPRHPAAGSANPHVPTIVIPDEQSTGGANPHIPYGTNPLVPYGTWTP